MQRVCFISHKHTGFDPDRHKLPFFFFLATEKKLLNQAKHFDSTAYFILHVKFNSLKCETNLHPLPPSFLNSPNVYNLDKCASLAGA